MAESTTCRHCTDTITANTFEALMAALAAHIRAKHPEVGSDEGF